MDTNSIKSGLSARSPDELALHQLRRNLFKLGKNQDQALKGLFCSFYTFIMYVCKMVYLLNKFV